MEWLRQSTLATTSTSLRYRRLLFLVTPGAWRSSLVSCQRAILSTSRFHPPPPPPRTIFLSSLPCSLPLLFSTSSLPPSLLPLLSSGQLLELHRGQGKEIYWRDSYSCPEEEEYMDMIRQSEYWLQGQLVP